MSQTLSLKPWFGTKSISVSKNYRSEVPVTLWLCVWVIEMSFTFVGRDHSFLFCFVFLWQMFSVSVRLWIINFITILYGKTKRELGLWGFVKVHKFWSRFNVSSQLRLLPLGLLLTGRKTWRSQTRFRTYPEWCLLTPLFSSYVLQLLSFVTPWDLGKINSFTPIVFFSLRTSKFTRVFRDGVSVISDKKVWF